MRPTGECTRKGNAPHVVARVLPATLIAALVSSCSFPTEKPADIAFSVGEGAIGAAYEETVMNVTGEVEGGMSARIRHRGSSESSFAIRIVSADGLDKDVSLFGFPPEHRWAILDVGALGGERYLSAVAIAQASGRYVPRAQSVTVSFGADLARPMLFSETPVRDGGRVSVTRLSAADYQPDVITGGYILRALPVEEVDLGDVTFVSSLGVPIVIDYPSSPNDAQISYLRAYLANVRDSMAPQLRDDPVAGIAAYVDLFAFADWVVFHEVCMLEPFADSDVFIAKDRDGKLTFGPAWDFGGALDGHSDLRRLYTIGAPFVCEILLSRQARRSIGERWRDIRASWLGDSSLIDGTGVVGSRIRSAETAELVVRRARVLDRHLGTW